LSRRRGAYKNLRHPLYVKQNLCYMFHIPGITLVQGGGGQKIRRHAIKAPSGRDFEGSSKIFIFLGCNPLKSLDSEK
jgi:hypothetical protein